MITLFEWVRKLFGASPTTTTTTTVKINTLIGEGTIISGDIELSGNIKIDGIVNGNIKTDGDVIVEESATIYGEIDAECVLVSGTVDGNIFAHDQITIASTARVKSDIKTPGFVVDVGSEYVGKCEIIEREDAHPQKTAMMNMVMEMDREEMTSEDMASTEMLPEETLSEEMLIEEQEPVTV